jgi:hypothetical protein
MGGCKKRLGNMGSVKIRTTRSIRLASHFLRATNSLSGGCEFESSASTITQHSDNIEDLWGTVFYIGDPA